MNNDNRQGYCPICHSNDLEYEAMQLEGDMAYYPYICSNCHSRGEEWYYMQFNGHNIETEVDGNIEEVEYVDLEKVRAERNIEVLNDGN